MSHNDYICEPETIEKQLDDYKKSTSLWSSIAWKYKAITKWLIIVIILLWYVISFLIGHIHINYNVVCEYWETKIIPTWWVNLIE